MGVVAASLAKFVITNPLTISVYSGFLGTLVLALFLSSLIYNPMAHNYVTLYTKWTTYWTAGSPDAALFYAI